MTDVLSEIVRQKARLYEGVGATEIRIGGIFLEILCDQLNEHALLVLGGHALEKRDRLKGEDLVGAKVLGLPVTIVEEDVVEVR